MSQVFQKVLDGAALTVGFGLTGAASMGLFFNEQHWTRQILEVAEPCNDAKEVLNPEHNNSVNSMVIVRGTLKPACPILSPFTYDEDSTEKFLHQFLWIQETVEFLQWHEEVVEGSKFPKKYIYKRIWSEERIPSENFKGDAAIEKSRSNPHIPLDLKTWRRSPQDGYTVSDFCIPRTLLYHPLINQPDSGNDHLAKLSSFVQTIIPKSLSYKSGFSARQDDDEKSDGVKGALVDAEDGWFYFRLASGNKEALDSDSKMAYQVGDFRVRISGVPKQAVTILGFHQSPNVIRPLSLQNMKSDKKPVNEKRIRKVSLAERDKYISRYPLAHQGRPSILDSIANTFLDSHSPLEIAAAELTEERMGKIPRARRPPKREIMEIFAFASGSVSKRGITSSLLSPLIIPRNQVRLLGFSLACVGAGTVMFGHSTLHSRFETLMDRLVLRLTELVGNKLDFEFYWNKLIGNLSGNENLVLSTIRKRGIYSLVAGLAATELMILYGQFYVRAEWWAYKQKVQSERKAKKGGKSIAAFYAPVDEFDEDSDDESEVGGD